MPLPPAQPLKRDRTSRPALDTVARALAHLPSTLKTVESFSFMALPPFRNYEFQD